MGHLGFESINGNTLQGACVLHGSLLVEVALKHSDILLEFTVIELHEIVEVCNCMRGAVSSHEHTFVQYLCVKLLMIQELMWN
jgi:hypothetical protein